MNKIVAIVDCALGTLVKDPDDALALHYLLTDKNTEIVGIITTFGNVSENTSFWSVNQILRRLNYTKISVIHGPRSRNDIRRSIDAARFIFEGLNENKNEVTILNLGPLTLLATLLNKYPNSSKLWKKLIIMGSLGNSKHKFYPLIKEEFNFSKDPEAVNTVLELTNPILVTYAQTSKVIFGKKEIMTYPTWMRAHLFVWYFLNRLVGSKGFSPHDLIAAQIANR
ncbi:MAG TPA: nucleoside hydrolase [Patescibacteria group bacterium]|nr:nucleoside hydrolase [Patescibacteria group bacterium]